MSTTGFIRRMLERGFSHEEALLAAEAFEAEVVDMTPTPTRTARQERNARYYESRKDRLKASEKRLNESETSYSDEQRSPDKEVSPTPPSRNYTPKGVCITTRTRKADDDPEGFQAFWDAYPLRVGRKVAAKAYASARQRGVSLGTLLAALDRDKATQWRDRPPDKIPHASTWLNQDRWLDEPPPPIPLRPAHERRHENPVLDRASSNLERAFAGAEIASRLRAVEPSSGF